MAMFFFKHLELSQILTGSNEVLSLEATGRALSATGVVLFSGELPNFEEQVQQATPPPLEIAKCSRKR